MTMDMLAQLKKDAAKEAIKYAVGKTMFCETKGCGKGLDYRTAALFEFTCKRDGDTVGRLFKVACPKCSGKIREQVETLKTLYKSALTADEVIIQETNINEADKVL